MQVKFPKPRIVAQFERQFAQMVADGTATENEKHDHWVMFVGDLVKRGEITHHQKNEWSSPFQR